MATQFNPSAYLDFQVRKDITYLYKRLLGELEELKTRHEGLIARLKRGIPAEYHDLIDSSDFLDVDGYASIRKQVLDAGNDAIRGLLQELAQFNISIK